MTTGAANLPLRYEATALLGAGGGGEVYAVRDVVTGEPLALKVLAAEGGEDEYASLLREATLLADAEGLGLPEVRAFGRTREGRAYLVRTLVAGAPLDRWARGREAHRIAGAVLTAMASVAVLHRFGLLHGDLKPANIVVDATGQGHLVDLGLAVPWSGEAAPARGFTPSYAAPELFEGASLDGRTEVFALACTLRDALALGAPSPELDAALNAVVAAASDPHRSGRPSGVDEFAHRLRRALAPFGVAPSAEHDRLDRWRLYGVDADAAVLAAKLDVWPPGRPFRLGGGAGAGISTLLRRWAWSAGVRGESVELVDGARSERAHDALAEETLAVLGDGGVLALDGLRLDAGALEELVARASRRRVRVVVTGASSPDASMTPTPLTREQARELVHRVRPDLGQRAAEELIERAAGRPGILRTALAELGSRLVVSIRDLDEARAGDGPPSLERVTGLLARGLVSEAQDKLAECTDRDSAKGRVLAARIALGRGAAEEALSLAGSSSSGEPEWSVVRARALLRLGKLAEALEATAGALGTEDVSVRAEALSLRAVSFSFRGALDEALAASHASLDAARDAGPRALAIAEGSHGLVLHRRGDRVAAVEAQERALSHAEQAADAALVAVSRLNLAAIAQESGDLERALRSLEPVVALARQAGQLIVVQQSLANLASLDLHLGRLEHARSTLDTLARAGEHVPSVEAHRLSLEGEWHELAGATSEALRLYEASASRWTDLGRADEGAFVRLEAALLALRTATTEPDAAEELLARELPHLAARGVHPLPELVRAAIAEARGALEEASSALERGRVAGVEGAVDDWLVRVFVARARVAEARGDRIAAAREIAAARSRVEQMASRLPPDLYEVFWNDPRRRSLRTGGSVTIPRASLPPGIRDGLVSVSGARTSDRLARLVEVTASLLAAPDASSVLAGILDHAMALVGGERGLLLVRDEGGDALPTVAAVRAMDGDVERREFSRSVAERVLRTAESVVTKSARADARLAGAESVHRLQLEALVCVPVRAEGKRAVAMGAIYIEVPRGFAAEVDRELAVLEAFADLAAVALLRARLADDHARARRELEVSNAELAQARAEIAQHLARRTEELQSARLELEATKAELRRGEGLGLLVGASEPMRRLYARIERVRDIDVPVLIAGESGTGKELVARAIHDTGARAKRPFLPINCGAIAANLLESELFGHERGAFTGADRARLGIFREAQGGTVFLDEIGELPLAMQAAFLRVLQERKVRPLGGRDEFAVDARVVVATNRDLRALVAEGKFREDLFYRLNVVELAVPPLRARPGDVPLLVEHFLRRFAKLHGRPRVGVAREALTALAGRAWPGNVRQLEHALLQAWLLADGEILQPADFAEEPVAPRPAAAAAAVRTEEDRHARDRRLIVEALEATGWNRQAAAARLGIPRRTFYRRLEAYGILSPRSHGNA